MQDLAEVFNEEVEAEPIEAVEPQEEAPVVEEAVETEPTGEKEEDSTPEPEAEEESKSVPISALMAERKQRQELQRQLDAQSKKEDMPDVFEDQQAYTQRLETTIQQAAFNEKANLSEFFARREYADLDSKIEVFNTLKTSNPALATQVQNAQSPYHEIVDIVDNHEKMERMSNVKEYEATTRAEIEAQVRAELEAEYKGKKDAKAELRDSIPTSLVNANSKGTISGQTWDGPTSLENIFND
jgi:hypothetical protein